MLRSPCSTAQNRTHRRVTLQTSTGSMSAYISSNESSSTSVRIRSGAEREKWYLHSGQTQSISSTSLRNTICSQVGHFIHTPSGTSFFFCTGAVGIGFLSAKSDGGRHEVLLEFGPQLGDGITQIRPAEHGGAGDDYVSARACDIHDRL